MTRAAIPLGPEEMPGSARPACTGRALLFYRLCRALPSVPASETFK